jgi:D-alanyl-D-alanine dipeptidase
MYISKRAKLEDVKNHLSADLSNVKKYSNSNTILLQKDAITALKKAQDDLPKDYTFAITYGHRTLEDQTNIVKQMESELKLSHPTNYKSLLKKYTGGYEELELKTFSRMNHRSGYAVDLKLLKNGKDLNLGGQQMNESDKIDYYTNKNNLSEKEKEIRDNRNILKTLSKYGFKNYKDEWWHWGFVRKIPKNSTPDEKEK